MATNSTTVSNDNFGHFSTATTAQHFTLTANLLAWFVTRQSGKKRLPHAA